MTDAAGLLLVLAVLYLGDCLVLVHRHGTLFSAPFCGTFRWRLPSGHLGNQQFGLCGLNPLPPLGSVFLAHPWPVSLSEEGVCAFTSQTLGDTGRPRQSGTAVLYNDIGSIRAEGKTLLVDDRFFVKCRSTRAARNLAETVRTIKEASPGDRGNLLDQRLDRFIQVGAPAEAASLFSRNTATLRNLCNLYWILVFVIGPLFVKFTNTGFALPRLAAAGILLHIAVLAFFYRAHKCLIPGERGQRLEELFKMGLCPPLALRACDAVSLHLLDRFHPLAVATALCSRNEAGAFAARLLRDLQHPVPVDLPPGDAVRIEAGYRKRLMATVIRFLRNYGFDPDAMLAPPKPEDEDQITFCPRCRKPYTLTEGRCDDCYGVPLQRFEPANSEGSAAA